MEKLIIEVFERKENPILSPNREINIDDFSNIDERNNAILFILEDDKGWTYEGKKAILKIRFRLADDIKTKLDKYLKDGVIKSYALNLWKVHRFEVNKNEATPEKEDELKLQLKILIEKSINMINTKTNMSF